MRALIIACSAHVTPRTELGTVRPFTRSLSRPFFFLLPPLPSSSPVFFFLSPFVLSCFFVFFLIPFIVFLFTLSYFFLFVSFFLAFPPPGSPFIRFFFTASRFVSPTFLYSFSASSSSCALLSFLLLLIIVLIYFLLFPSRSSLFHLLSVTFIPLPSPPLLTLFSLFSASSPSPLLLSSFCNVSSCYCPPALPFPPRSFPLHRPPILPTFTFFTFLFFFLCSTSISFPFSSSLCIASSCYCPPAFPLSPNVFRISARVLWSS